MAADWIPYCKDLPQKVEVLTLASRCGMSTAEVVFALLRFWAWTDAQSEDGVLRPLSVQVLSVLFPDVPGAFWDAMRDVGWLCDCEGGMKVVNFEVWMGRSAKARLKDARRKRQDRQVSTSEAPMSAPARTSVRPGVLPASGPHPDKNRVTQHNRDTTETEETPPTPLGGDVCVGHPRKEARASPVGSHHNGGATEPQPPPPARRRAPLPCDDPELAAAAKRVVEHYDHEVRSAYPGTSAIPAVMALLAYGHPGTVTAEALCRAATGYGRRCDRYDLEPRRRRSAKNFYALEGGDYVAFLGWTPEDEAKLERRDAEARAARATTAPAAAAAPAAADPMAERIKEAFRRSRTSGSGGGQQGPQQQQQQPSPSPSPPAAEEEANHGCE